MTNHRCCRVELLVSHLRPECAAWKFPNALEFYLNDFLAEFNEFRFKVQNWERKQGYPVPGRINTFPDGSIKNTIPLLPLGVSIECSMEM